MVEALEHAHRTPGARKIGSGDECVVSTADDDDVGPRIGDQLR
jgi:hypothetical protein